MEEQVNAIPQQGLFNQANGVTPLPTDAQPPVGGANPPVTEGFTPTQPQATTPTQPQVTTPTQQQGVTPTQQQATTPTPVPQQQVTQDTAKNVNEGNTPVAQPKQPEKNGKVGQLTNICNDIELVVVRANLEGSSVTTTTMVTLDDFSRVELSHGEGIIVPREYGETLTRLDGGVLFIDDTIKVSLDIVPA